MAILWARNTLRRGTAVDDAGQQTFHSEYIVKSNTPTELRDAVLACGLIPVYGAPHPENMNANCVRVTADKNPGDPTLWDVSADWRTNPASKRDPADQQKAPDIRRPKWSCKFVEIPISRYVDRQGYIFASSAGQPFDPVPNIPIIADEITVVRYEPYCNRNFQRSFMDSTNEDTWFGAIPGTACVTNITVNDEYIQGKYWFLTTYTLLIKPRITITLPKGGTQQIGGFDPEYVLDMGTLELIVNGANKIVVPIVRTDPVSGKPFYDGRPTLLNGVGLRLAQDPSTGQYLFDPVFLEFKTKFSLPYTTLGLIPPEGLTG